MGDKISNINDNRLNVVDVFSGVGGLSLGAARAGFKVIAAIDIDKRMLDSHAINFPSCLHIETDITNLDGTQLSEKTGLHTEYFGLIGGPPCQGFSRIGRRKRNDLRNTYFSHFFRLVAESRPCFYLAENVLGILDNKYDRIRHKAFSQIEGYKNIKPLILKASDYGAATSRKRVFFIGYMPEHFKDINVSHFDPPSNVSTVNVGTALRGLRKKISPNWQSKEQGYRPLTCKPNGWFLKKTLNDIPQGIGDPESIRRLKNENLVSGCLGTRHSQEVTERFTTLAEGSVDKPSRAVRLKRNGFCPTLRSGTGPDHGSYQALRPIHPTEPRVITPREAARLQGFPDWFQFDSTKWYSFRQIGNSVSPVLAEAVLTIIKDAIKIRNDS